MDNQTQIDKNRQKSTNNRQTSRQLNRQMHVCMSMPARQASQRQSDDVWARNACPHALLLSHPHHIAPMRKETHATRAVSGKPHTFEDPKDPQK